MATGASFRIFGFLPYDFILSWSRVTFKVFLPALIISHLKSFDVSNWGGFLLVGGATFYALLMAFLLAFLFAPRFVRERSPAVAEYFQGAFRSNYSVLSFYFALKLIPAHALPEVIVIIMLGAVLNNSTTALLYAVYLPRKSRGSLFLHIIFKIMQNPLVIGAVLAILLSMLPWHLPKPVMSTITLLGQSAMPSSLMIGGYLCAMRSPSSFRWSLVIKASLIKSLLVPVSALVLAAVVFHASQLSLLTILILTIPPVSANAVPQALSEGAQGFLVSREVVVTVFASFLIFPLLLAVLPHF